MLGVVAPVPVDHARLDMELVGRCALYVMMRLRDSLPTDLRATFWRSGSLWWPQLQCVTAAISVPLLPCAAAVGAWLVKYRGRIAIFYDPRLTEEEKCRCVIRRLAGHILTESKSPAWEAQEQVWADTVAAAERAVETGTYGHARLRRLRYDLKPLPPP